MARQAVIQGTYADLKTIKSRSVVQVVIEVPIERGQEIVEAFGFPQPASEVHVAIARLASVHESEAQPDRRRFNELPIAQQAALACGDPVFRAFLREEMNASPAVREEKEAAAWLRSWFHVDSRRQIGADAWADFYSRFRAWKAAEAA